MIVHTRNIIRGELPAGYWLLSLQKVPLSGLTYEVWSMKLFHDTISMSLFGILVLWSTVERKFTPLLNILHKTEFVPVLFIPSLVVKAERGGDWLIIGEKENKKWRRGAKKCLHPTKRNLDINTWILVKRQIEHRATQDTKRKWNKRL